MARFTPAIDHTNHPELEWLRSRVRTFATQSPDGRRQSLNALLAELLNRPETLTLYNEDLSRGRSIEQAMEGLGTAPYGLNNPQNLEPDYVAYELGRALLDESTVDRQTLDPDMVKIVESRIDVAKPDNPEDVHVYGSTAVKEALTSLGYSAFLATKPNLDQIRHALVVISAKQSTRYAQKEYERAITIGADSLVPTFSVNALGLYRLKTFEITRVPDLPDVIKVVVHEPGKPDRLATTSFLNDPQTEFLASSGLPAKQAVGYVVLNEIGLNPMESGALQSEGCGPVGFAVVAEAAVNEVMRTGRSVTITADRVADWILKCEKSFVGPAIAGSQVQPLPPVQLNDVIDGSRGHGLA